MEMFIGAKVSFLKNLDLRKPNRPLHICIAATEEDMFSEASLTASFALSLSMRYRSQNPEELHWRGS